jgi:hypothetical protein
MDASRDRALVHSPDYLYLCFTYRSSHNNSNPLWLQWRLQHQLPTLIRRNPSRTQLRSAVSDPRPAHAGRLCAAINHLLGSPTINPLTGPIAPSRSLRVIDRAVTLTHPNAAYFAGPARHRRWTTRWLVWPPAPCMLSDLIYPQALHLLYQLPAYGLRLSP